MASPADPLREAGLLDLGDVNPLAQWDLREDDSRLRIPQDPDADVSRVPECASSLPTTSRSEPCAIDSLPPEILLAIFSLLTYDITDNGYKWYYSPSCIAVTHVCTRWRALALSSPSLWTGISFAYSSMSYVGAMLRRSAHLPIDLAFGSRLGSGRGLPIALTISLSAGFPDVRTLHLHLPPEQLEICACVMSRDPALDAPVLERLHLRAYGRPLRGYFFTALCAPRLRSVVLDGVPLSARTLAGSTEELHELVLTGFPGEWRWSVREVLGILRRAPRLRTLALTEALRAPDDDGDDEDGGGGEVEDEGALPDVAPAELAQLTLHAPTRAVAALLARLALPRTTACILNCVARTPADCMLADCVPRTMRCARLSVRMSITASSMVFHATPDASDRAALELALQPERALAPTHSSGFSALLDVCARVDMSGVRALSLFFDDVVRDETVPVIVDALGKAMEGVEVLETSVTVLGRVHEWSKLGGARKVVLRGTADREMTAGIVKERFRRVEEVVLGEETLRFEPEH